MGFELRLRGVLVTGLCTLAACRCEDPPPPPDPADADERLILLEGRFLDFERVELVFSDPLTPVDGVDPQKFRLSIARYEHTESAGGCESSSEYCELSLGLDDLGCVGCGGSYSDPEEDCPEPTIVDELALDPDDDSRLHLHISPPISRLRCEQLEFVGPSANVIVHFSAFDVPTITDQGGRELEAIAPHWALSGRMTEYRYAELFPALDALVPIPCPEDDG